jgi:hypothetical protein
MFLFPAFKIEFVSLLEAFQLVRLSGIHFAEQPIHNVYPVTEDELNQVVSKLQGKSATGFDRIPEFLVKECIQYIKNPLIFIFNVISYHISINQGIFPDVMKIEIYCPFSKSVIDMTVVITDLYPFYQFSQKL